jgi:hypothetical protein
VWWSHGFAAHPARQGLHGNRRAPAARSRALRSSATAIPVHIAARKPERLARAHTAAGRVHVMLIVAQSWAYVPADDLADAQRTLPASSRRSRPGVAVLTDAMFELLVRGKKRNVAGTGSPGSKNE